MPAMCKDNGLTFQLTAPRGGRLSSSAFWIEYGSFQLTAPQGGRHTAFDVSRTKTTDFNSRPREGADWHWDLWQIVLSRISTHGPARGPTLIASRGFRPLKFQLTAPRGGRLSCSHDGRINFSISTHGPARGPTERNEHGRELQTISTHGPARGPTFPGLDVITANIFQLTAPRGGRQQF